MASNRPERREYQRVRKIEKREYQRVIVKLEAELSAAQMVQISGWTRDLSVKGVYVLCADKLPIGARCLCRLALGDVLKGAPVIEAEGKIVRCDNEGIAIQFTDVAIDAFKKLRAYFFVE